MNEQSEDIEKYFVGDKLTHYNHSSPGSFATKTPLSKYKGKMGKLVNAGKLLRAIENAGSEMKLPNIYVAPNTEVVIDLSRFFRDGETLEYAINVEDKAVATAKIEGTILTVTGVAEGFTLLNIMVGGTEHTVNVTVRSSANNNGWM
jgi:hypothetical protein